MYLLLLSLFTQDPTTDLGYLDIVSQRYFPRLLVEVNDEAPSDALIISDPVSVRCGAKAYQHGLPDSPRQCWIKRRPGTTITLSARIPANNRLEWLDCPQVTGTTCTVTIEREDMVVRARFVPLLG